MSSKAVGEEPDKRKETEAIALGYGVIEEHMRRAKSIARKYHSTKPKKFEPTSPDLQTVMGRLFRSIADLAPVVGELVNSLGSAGFAQVTASANSAAVNHTTQPGFQNANARVNIAVSSKLPAIVRLELRPDSENRALVVGGLYAPEANTPSIKEIEFAPALNGDKASLRIRIPRIRAGLTYSGLLVDRQSGEPHGVLSVCIAK